jgi:hypothetical protein
LSQESAVRQAGLRDEGVKRRRRRRMIGGSLYTVIIAVVFLTVLSVMKC